MERHEFLAALHAGLRPRNYLEIGVDTGLSLELSRVPSIGIDPKFQVRTEIRTDVALVRATSDRFFARRDPLKYVRGTRNPWRNLRHDRPLLGRLVGRPTIDFAFIDGMHLFEYVLRDFMNVGTLFVPDHGDRVRRHAPAQRPGGEPGTDRPRTGPATSTS